MKNDDTQKTQNNIMSLFKKKRRGSALAAVLIVCTCVGVVAGSSMQQSTTDRRLNRYAALNAEARNAAEAIAEYGLADLTYRFNTQNTFASDSLRPSKNPLTLPASFYTEFANSNVVMPSNPYNASVGPGTYQTEIVGGSIPDAGRTFIDGSIPGNENDPLADRSIIVRQVRVYGKAMVRDPSGITVTARYRRSLQVRDAPLFSYAIFYNMPLEFIVGPDMDVTGPVHTNSDLYLECDNSLTFHDKVTAVGKIRHDLRRGPDGKLVYGTETVGNGNIWFPNAKGTSTNMKIGYSTWVDSNYSDWYNKSRELWVGNVQDEAYSVRTCQSVGFPSYVEDNPYTATDEMRDDAYKMIMPLDTTTSANPDVEKQKYAYKAGLVVTVNTASGKITSYSLYAQKFDANGNLIYSGTNPARTLLCTYVDASGGNSDPEIKANLEAIFDIKNYASGGMYDQRRGEGIDLLEVDMGKLRDALEDNDARDWGNTTSSIDATYRPQTWWNGIIYFQFPQDTSDIKGVDGVQISEDELGLRLKNAKASGSGTTYIPGIPNPSWSSETGTTIATNNTMYIYGNYNADGNSGTGSNTAIDNNTTEPAASIIADSITFLSQNWSDSKSMLSYYSNRVASDFTEVSAAVISGIVPTNSDGNKCRSGAVNNFPRFLENFKGKTLRYRGSMVVLYESELGCENFSTGTYYDPPVRNWGFNVQFENGIFPPGTPNIRTFKRVDSKYLSDNQWAAEVGALQ